MAVDVRIIAAVFLTFTTSVVSQGLLFQDRCVYMTQIPRLPRPENLPVFDHEGLTWNERPLIEIPREDLCLDSYFRETNELFQVIFVDEEREGDFALAKLNYDGPHTPTIGPSFESGAFNNLRPELRKEEDGAWYLYTTVRQNYEANMRYYIFQIVIQDSTTSERVAEFLPVSVILHIVNIDDNPPIMELVERCVVPEMGEARLTECVYRVEDADGCISTQFMSFQVVSDRDDDQIFYMHGTTDPDECFYMNMTVAIRSPLNFEENPLHIFTVIASDSLPNNDTATMTVQVQNVEHRPPRWVEIFPVQQFKEKSRQNFTIRAIDGDTGINKPIYYRIETEPEDTFFSIENIEGDRSGAILHVDEINRDLLEREVFQLTIIAYKYDNESFATAAPVVIIVEDINDNYPKPTHDVISITIDEETAMTLDLTEFFFHDIDLGQNAQYTVHLESSSPPGENAEQAFYIAPTVGYQRQEFFMGTTNHSMLDFENIPFQHIILRVVAIDMDMPFENYTGVSTLHIHLRNWNDEEPIFGSSEQIVYMNETVGAGHHVATVRATDRDIGDRVEHSLMGNAADFLRIDAYTGDIYVLANDSFDYHRQNVYFVQVRADDTLGEPYHTATAQLVIHLLDINNTPPTLRLPRGSPQVDENEPSGYNITKPDGLLTATDPDTTAHLVFEIDWETSWATKQGRDADPSEYHNRVAIITEYPEEENLGLATGRLEVREIGTNVTIDFEMFEVLYLTIRVRDSNTYIGPDFDEATFAVTIVDRNDNPPIWEEGTLQQNFTVREMANRGTVIGSILATDIDGPLYNQVRYRMYPEEDTPEELVEINPISGQITVRTSHAIDADDPPREYLHYRVVARDNCTTDPQDCPPDDHYHNTTGHIAIYIMDINNKVPDPEFQNISVYIYENATSGDEVTYILATDDDRDEIYHTVSYLINYAVNSRLLDFFVVERDSGRLFVNYSGTDVLDRDGDEPHHQIFIQLIDNFYREGDGNRNQNETEIHVILLDVNDNAPKLPNPSDHTWTTSENLDADISVAPILHAPDRDEPGTNNSLVGFRIVSLTLTNRDLEAPDLFLIRSVGTDEAELISTMPLRGYWGTYDIHIEAFDHGEPQRDSNETYSLIINPYNYHAPVFVFPEDGALIRFARESAVQNSFLMTVGMETFRLLEATDEDGLEAGIVTFSVTENDEAVEYFEISTNGAGENQAALILRRTITEPSREFQITIRATDRGTDPGPLWSEITFRAVFVPTTGDPVFPNNTEDVAFIEREAGLLEYHELRHAYDPKNEHCSDDCHEVYYRIVDGNNEGLFALDPVTNNLTLTAALDRAVREEHTLFIGAGNSPTGGIPPSSSMLTVTVTVREAGARPVFLRELYMAGISTQSSVSNELLTVQATHTDQLPISYSIDNESMVADSSLSAVRDSAFALDPVSGLLTLAMQPTASMNGMFEFKVIATDTEGGTGTADVKVYLITTRNRVTFIFNNTLRQIEDNIEYIEDSLSEGFQMRCNVERPVVPATDSSGALDEGKVEVRAHFIANDRPVPVALIEPERTNVNLISDINKALQERELYLENFYTELSPALGLDPSQVAVYVLAALAALFALISIVLLVGFVIRTRALNRQLQAQSVVKPDSVDSGLHPVGLVSFPGANKHAAEGSNPVYNETLRAPDFDAISDVSDESDLVGIEHLPQFSTEYFPPGDGRSLDDVGPHTQPNLVPNHSNNFGSRPTAFNPQVANNRFSRV